MGPEHMRRFEELVHRTLAKYGSTVLVLIPCSKSKRVTPYTGKTDPPLPDVEGLRAELLKAIKATPELRRRTENAEGVLREEAPVTRAMDLYTGRFYTRAREALLDIHRGRYPFIHTLIVSALYGLVRLGEGLRIYDLTMTDKLANGLRVHELWEKRGLWRALLRYIIDNRVRAVWSLLPNSREFPYHQVFRPLWGMLEAAGIRCAHVEFPGAGTSTGMMRAEWFVYVVKKNPLALIDPRKEVAFRASKHRAEYVSCRSAT